jgi:nitrous oxidase accessory protein NosD
LAAPAPAPLAVPLFATRYAACLRIPDDARGTFGGASAVVVLNSSRSVLEGADVSATGCQIGIYIAPNTPSARINHVQVSGGTFGIVVDGARNVLISNATIEGGRKAATGGIGILFQPNAEGAVNRSIVTHTGVGIELTGARVVVRDGELDDTTDGLIAEKSSTLTLSRTTAARALDFGFYCSDSRLLSVERNVARDNGMFGFYFARCTGVAGAAELARRNAASSGNPNGDFEVIP